MLFIELFYVGSSNTFTNDAMPITVYYIILNLQYCTGLHIFLRIQAY